MSIISIFNITFNFIKRSIIENNEKITQLTPTEYYYLEYLEKNYQIQIYSI